MAISKKTEQAVERELARMALREIFAKQETPRVYTILRHVSTSGMSRDISLFTIVDGEKVNLTYTAAEALGEKVRNSHGFNAIRVPGVGMDMGFGLVYNLSCVLFGSADQGGYTLKQEWA